MENESNDSNATNNSSIPPCEPAYSENVIYGLIYFRCVLAIISILFISSMLAIMVLFKKYRFFTQRLILYLAISTLAYQIVSAIDVTSFRAYSDEEALQYCKAIGFITQSLIWWPLIATLVIVFDIFVHVVLEKSTERLEILYLIMTFCVSPFVSLIAFANSSYGPLQYFCWIATASCDQRDLDIAFYIRVALFYVPWYIIVLGVVILMVIVLVVLRRWRNAYGGKYDPQAAALKKKMEKEVRPILYYPIIFALSSLMSLIITIYALSSINNEVGFIIISVINSILFRLQGVFLTLVFAFDPETRKKLSIMEIKAAAARFMKEEENNEYPAKYNTRSDSVKIPPDKKTEATE